MLNFLTMAHPEKKWPVSMPVYTIVWENWAFLLDMVKISNLTTTLR